MREFTKADLQEIFVTFEEHKRSYERMVSNLNKRIITMGKQGNLSGSLKLSAEMAVYRERLGYCVAVFGHDQVDYGWKDAKYESHSSISKTTYS